MQLIFEPKDEAWPPSYCGWCSPRRCEVSELSAVVSPKCVGTLSYSSACPGVFCDDDRRRREDFNDACNALLPADESRVNIACVGGADAERENHMKGRVPVGCAQEGEMMLQILLQVCPSFPCHASSGSCIAADCVQEAAP